MVLGFPLYLTLSSRKLNSQALIPLVSLRWKSTAYLMQGVEKSDKLVIEKSNQVIQTIYSQNTYLYLKLPKLCDTKYGYFFYDKSTLSMCYNSWKL